MSTKQTNVTAAIPQTPDIALPIKIFLKSVGSAPALSQQKYKLAGTKTVLDIELYLRKKISSLCIPSLSPSTASHFQASSQSSGHTAGTHSSQTEAPAPAPDARPLPLFLYVAAHGFAPTPDHLIADLYRDFGSGGELVLCYGMQETWG